MTVHLFPEDPFFDQTHACPVDVASLRVSQTNTGEEVSFTCTSLNSSAAVPQFPFRTAATAMNADMDIDLFFFRSLAAKNLHGEIPTE
jgi:hypothetical protein